jgi:hypothetical protein
MNDKNGSLHRSNRFVAISVRAYRILLATYPAAFRERYGPEMAQVFRTSCRLAYLASGASGVVRLWPAILWDWVGSAAWEWFSRPFRRSNVYHIHVGRASSQLIPMLLFLSACLICLFLNPCAWMGSEFFGAWTCRLDIKNRSDMLLRATPIQVNRDSFSALRLYRTNFPIFPAYQQRNIAVQPGGTVTLDYACGEESGPVELVAVVCDPQGACFVSTDYKFNYSPGAPAGRFVFTSLENLSPPEAALESVVQSIPEHNYSGFKIALLCSIGIFALIGGVYGLVRAKTVEIPTDEL